MAVHLCSAVYGSDGKRRAEQKILEMVFQSNSY